MVDNRLLIVDDNKLNLNLLVKLLQSEYSIDVANNGAQALEMIQKKDYSCVLLDIVMPVMDGYEVIKEVRSLDAYSSLPIIVMTSSDEKERESMALSLGAWDFVRKPFDPEILKFRIKNAIVRGQYYLLEKLKYVTTYDSLCDIYNKDAFCVQVKKRLEFEQGPCDYYLIRFDIDRFTIFNYYYGIEEGNKILKYIAEQLKEFRKKYDILFCRVSSDVFAIFLKGNRDILMDLVDQLTVQLKKYSSTFDILPTFGVYKVVDRNTEVQQMFDKAFLASKTIKTQYEKKYALYDKQMSQEVINEQKIISEMNGALANHEFVIYLQPKVEIETSKVVGAESLVRWIKDGKVIPPAEFIPIFERNGFISRLDIYVWEETLRYISERKKQGKPLFPISVNVSRVHFFSSNIVQTIVSLADKYQVEHRYLELEVTESIFMEDISSVKNSINQLRHLGFKVLIDDFGSGYSSLNVLKDIEFDVLKIDFKFLSHEGEYERGKKIIDSVVKLSHTLEITAIAEGVETVEQCNLLKNIGCNYAQGYYYSKPVSVDKFETMVDNTSIGKTENIKPTILIADDDKLSRAQLKRIVEKDYNVVEANDGLEAIDILTSQKIDLVLLDLYMPNMNGMEVLSVKNKNNSLVTIPTIIISSAPESEKKFEMLSLGANDYITKPISIDLLKTKIEVLLKLKNRYQDVFTDINTMSQYAMTDELTSLPNRSYFISLVNHTILNDINAHYLFMILDIDKFKNINDTYGHPIGDKCLKVVAEVMKNSFAKDYYICRLGGDEFAIFSQKHIETKATDQTIADFRHAIQNSLLDQNIYLTLSIGAREYNKGDTFESMYKEADSALYKAKNNGGNCTIYYAKKGK